MTPRLRSCDNPTCCICYGNRVFGPPDSGHPEPLRHALLALAGVVLFGLAVVLVWAACGTAGGGVSGAVVLVWAGAS